MSSDLGLGGAGADGVGAVFQRAPAVMLCKPTTNDRWDRRAVELAAFQHLHGHCNVPKVRRGKVDSVRTWDDIKSLT